MVASGLIGHFQMLALAWLQEVPGEAAWQWPALVLAILGEALAVVFVARVLIRGGSPPSNLLWVVVILAAPWVGLLLYYLFPRRLQMRRLRRRQNRLAWIEEELDRLRPAESEVHHGDPLVRLLHRIDGDAVHDGNRVTWLAGGREFFEEALRAVANAKDFVHLEVYILRHDEAGRLLLDALTEAARRGIEVRLLYDSFGSFGVSGASLADLVAAGGEVEAFLPLLWRRRPFTLNLRNHRKLLVVDGTHAFLGGRNIGNEYATDRLGRTQKWLDAMLHVEGPVVPRLHRVFVEDWYNACGRDLAQERYFPQVPPLGRDAVGALVSGPDRDIHGLWWAIFQVISGARHAIEICSPYLVPPPTMLFALKVAAARGVRVRIHTNGPEAEAFILYHAQRSYYGEFLRSGIELFETVSDYNHAKLIVVDGETVVVGSMNLDMRSAHLNFELGAVVLRSHVAGSAMAMLEDRRRLSRRIGFDDLPKAAPVRLLDGFCRLASPLL